MRKKRVRHSAFLLIEVLLAVALIALCTYPLLSAQFKMTLAQRKSLEKRQLERYAGESYLEILQSLYEGRLPGGGQATWEAFQKPITGCLTDRFPLYFGHGNIQDYRCDFEIIPLYGSAETVKERDNYRLMDIHLAFQKNQNAEQPLKYIYRIVIEREGYAQVK